MARYRDVQVCQQCGRKFLGRKALLCHMNHPFGTCYNHVQEVANLFEDLQSYSGLKHQSQRPSPLSSDDGNNTVQPTNQEPMDVDPDPLISYDMDKFKLPDLCGALADFLDRFNYGQPLKIGGRRAADANSPLPFDHLQVWTKVRLQNRSYHTPHHILPPQTINVLPPSEAWTPGLCDVVLINTDNNKVWPHSGLEGVSSSCMSVSFY